jgi:hypothetical protein
MLALASAVPIVDQLAILAPKGRRAEDAALRGVNQRCREAAPVRETTASSVSVRFR